MCDDHADILASASYSTPTQAIPTQAIHPSSRAVSFAAPHARTNARDHDDMQLAVAGERVVRQIASGLLSLATHALTMTKTRA